MRKPSYTYSFACKDLIIIVVQSTIKSLLSFIILYFTHTHIYKGNNLTDNEDQDLKSKIEIEAT